MANELYDALMQGAERELIKNFAYGIGSSFANAPAMKFADNVNPWAGLAANLGARFLGGALMGAGGKYETRGLQDRQMALAELQAQNPDPGSLYRALAGSEDKQLQALAPVVQKQIAKELAERKKQEMQLMYSPPKPVVVGDETKYLQFAPGQGWQYIEGLGGPRRNPVTNVNVGVKSPYEMEKDARSEIANLPATKTLADVAPLWEHAKAVAMQDTPAADISLISSIARINDPGSTVHTGEIELNMEAQTFLDRNAGNWRAVVEGKGRLTPKTRAQLLMAAGEKIKALQKAYETQIDRIVGGYAGYGAKPENIKILDMPAFEPFVPPGMKLLRNKITGETKLVPQ